MAINVSIYLEVNKDLVQLYKGAVSAIPRVGELVKFPYKRENLVAEVIRISHNLEEQDVSLYVIIKEEIVSQGMTTSHSYYSTTN